MRDFWALDEHATGCGRLARPQRRRRTPRSKPDATSPRRADSLPDDDSQRRLTESGQAPPLPNFST